MAFEGFTESGGGSEQRGPGTFTFTPPQAPQGRTVQAVQQQMGYQTAESVGGITQYDTAADATGAAIFGFAESILGPKLEELRAKRFLEGIQRAATGEALTDIINSQPWYSKIFGPSTAVEGARQYTLDAKAAEFDAAVEQAMPELRSMAPDAIPEYLMKLGDEFKTGDTQTDAALGLRLVKTLPNLIQRHAREFYKAQQEQAHKARTDAWLGLGQSYQLHASSDMSTEDDVLLRQGEFLSALVLPPGVDEASWAQSLGATALSFAEAGNFHALGLMQDSGVLQALSPEDRIRLDKQIKAARHAHARESFGDYAMEVAEIDLKIAQGGYTDGGQLLADYQRINDKYRKASGNTEPLVGQAVQAKGAMTAAQAMLKRNQALAKAAGEEVDAAARQQTLFQMVMTSGTAATKAAVGPGGEKFKAYEVDQMFLGQYQQLNPEGRMALLMADAQRGGTVDAVREDFQNIERSLTENYDDNALALYMLWAEADRLHPRDTDMPNPVHSRYFSSEAHARMSKFHAALRGRDPAQFGELAWSQTRKIISNPGYNYTKDESKAMDEMIDKDWRAAKIGDGSVLGFSGNEAAYFLGRPAKLWPSSMHTIRQSAAEHYGDLKQGRPDTAMRDSLEMAMQSGLEGLGRQAWRSTRGREKVEDMLAYGHLDSPITKHEAAIGMDLAVDEAVAKMVDGTPDDVIVIRIEDTPTNMPQFLVYAVKDGEETFPVTINGHDMVRHVAEDRPRKALAKLAKQRAIKGNPGRVLAEHEARRWDDLYPDTE